MIIDAHHHLWTADLAWLQDPALAAIRRDYTVEDLRANMRAAGVDRTVLVEAGRETDAETTAFLALAQVTPEILGVVGWASLTDPALADTIAKHRDGPLVGIRDQVQAHPDDHLDRPDVRAGLATVARAAAALPDSTFVLDHLGKPLIAAGALDEWRGLIAPVAARPNVVAKLSGLVTEANWATLRPFVLAAVELFGTDRLMFGSDWPVCEVAATYGQTKEAMVEILGGTPPDVFAGTAIRTYRLEVPCG
jgi:L-fuconolactonase